MNLSLRNRVATSFVVANLVILVLSFMVFHYLNNLNNKIESITVRSNKVSLLTDEIRISAVSILKYQRKFLTQESRSELVEKITSLCERFTSQLQRLDTHYKDPEVKKVIAQMLSYVDSLKLVLSKTSLFHRDDVGVSSISELSDKILDAFSEFQGIHHFQSIQKDKKIKGIISETKRNMMITLIIGFLGTIILGLVVPGKIALPFKKIKDAIRELQDCNFDVNIYYNQDDEIGEIAVEMNKMIHSFKKFEELRTDRISVEKRKFDVLANMFKRPILVANAESELMYINSKLYSLLEVQSEDIIGKVMVDSVIPPTIIETYNLAIKRRSKIENAEIIIYAKKAPVEEENEEAKTAKSTEESPTVEVEGEREIAFQGFANVIPIRGKDSSLDYYLMVISNEVFV